MNLELQVPHNIDAEIAVIGGIFLDESIIVELLDEIEVDDFYDNRNRIIFKAIIELHNQGKNIDMTSVISYLDSVGQLQVVGGIDYLSSLINYSYSTSNMATYVALVKEASLKRIAIDRLNTLAQEGYNNKTAANEYITKVEEAVFDLSKRRKTSNFVTIKEVTETVKANMAKNIGNDGGITGLNTGFSHLNRATLGFQPEQLIILAARPAMGKSALAMNLAVNVAQHNNNGKANVAVFSLEMAVDQIVERMIAADGSLHLSNLKTGELNGSEMRQYYVSCEKLNRLNLYFDDSSFITIEDIRTKCRKLKATTGLDFVVIDYLQLIDGSGSGAKSRQEEVAKISRGLKMMARELGIPVMALAQLSREVEKREDKKPVMADLRDSGGIEQDADIIMFLYREEYYNRDKNQEKHMSEQAQLIIAKNRGGTAGVELDFMFQGRYAKFMEADKGEN